MSNFKKQYHDTFNDIHAPDSIKQEVFRMSNTIDHNTKFDTSNNVVETTEVEVSRRFSSSRVVAFATCVALIVGGGLGFSYFKGSNRVLTVGDSNGETSSSSSSTDVQVQRVSTVDNSNFEDIFGVRLEDLKLVEILAGDTINDNIIALINDSNAMNSIMNSLNTATWQYSDVDLSNDTTVLDIFNIHCSNTNTILLTFMMKDGDTYVDVDGLSYYKVDYSIFENVSNLVHDNNSIYFDINPSNSLSVNFDTMGDSYVVTDTSIISDISYSLFNSFTWTDDTGSAEESLEDGCQEELQFKQSYNDTEYVTTLYYFGDYIDCKIEVNSSTNGYAYISSLTSNSLEEDYNRLIGLIKNQAVTTTTETPKDTTVTTEDKGDESIISGQLNKIYVPVDTDRHYYGSISYNMQDANDSPQFLDDDAQQFFAEAYSIAQNFAWGCPFNTSDESEPIVIGDKMYKPSPFNTLDEVREYLGQYFTSSYISSNSMMDKFIQQDGTVYFEYSAKGGKMQYLGHSFELDSQSSSAIEFHANVYFYSGEGVLDLACFYYQEPDIKHVTDTCNYNLINTQNGWRFDTLEVMQ